MKTAIRPGKVISNKELEVVANFTNGFAQNVLELSDGTLIFISYIEIPALVNSIEDEE